MYISYITLMSGLLISVVGEFYSILGLMAIFPANPISVAIMGIALGIGKVVGTTWLKQNWNIAPIYVKIYLLIAIFILMSITSIGIFGLLSKAHSDQGLISGDAQAKVAVYDEKIKVAKENIDVNRKALKQMDEAVDQVMGRSTDEKGADKAVQIRKGQQKERSRLLADIEAEQKKISQYMEDRAPLAAQNRQLEAEVGPIKYIAAFVYGDTNAAILEKAVTWVIILLIIVFDPLAVILLLAAQTSFQNFREREKEIDEFYEINQAQRDYFKNFESEVPNDFTLNDVENEGKDLNIPENSNTADKAFDINKHPYLFKTPVSRHPPGIDPVGPMVHSTPAPELEKNVIEENTIPAEPISHDDYLNASQEKLEESITRYSSMVRNKQLSMNDVPRVLLEAVKARV